MRNLDVNLIKKAADILNEVATALNMDSEGAFEYIVRNALKVYHVVELSGHIMLIDGMGNMEVLHFLNDSPSSTLSEKIITKFFRKSQQESAPEPTLHHALLDEQVIEDVELQAKVYGFSRTDLYNRLVIIGGVLALHLQEDQAFAYNKSGDALGKIEFTLAQ